MILKVNPVFKTLICILIFTAFSTTLQSQNQEREFYQLKTYTLENENQENLVDTYLENAYLPALKRMGIHNVGVFKMHSSKYIISNKIFVLIPFSSLAKLYAMEARLWNDTAYQKAGKEYLETTYDQPPYDRVKTTLMVAFEDMPKMSASKVKGSREDRIYELRSYESPTEEIFKNKVDMFNAGGEVKLFEELGFNAVFYAEVLSGDKMPNLMYMTTFENQESRDKHWDAFRNAPKWKEISSKPKYQNNVSHIDRLFLYPTEYSDY
jgi:NIPSNAP protein